MTREQRSRNSPHDAGAPLGQAVRLPGRSRAGAPAGLTAAGSIGKGDVR